ncbi:MAG TPA: hypothetical protein VFW09_07540 [Solirubrobacteraceae bacterium]|nr:hypothetical protein [Solirubrobacteraceae bacterium]
MAVNDFVLKASRPLGLADSFNVVPAPFAADVDVLELALDDVEVVLADAGLVLDDAVVEVDDDGVPAEGVVVAALLPHAATASATSGTAINGSFLGM